jgi:hypothetical protein
VVPVISVLPKTVVDVDGCAELGVVTFTGGLVVVLVLGMLGAFVDDAFGVGPPQAARTIVIAATTDTAISRHHAVRCIDVLVSDALLIPVKPADKEAGRTDTTSGSYSTALSSLEPFSTFWRAPGGVSKHHTSTSGFEVDTWNPHLVDGPVGATRKGRALSGPPLSDCCVAW